MRSRVVTASVLIAVALIATSLALSPYKDEQSFHERYMTMGPGDSEQYWELRDEMLTAKYQLQDYGITLLALALTFYFATRSERFEVNSPKRTATLVAIAVALPVVSAAGYVFDLLQALLRGEFPHWADSLGIPLAGVPILGTSLLAWSLLHLLFLFGGYTPGRLRYAFSRRANFWLLFVSGLTALLILYALVFGQYWYAIPGTFWLYYYLSLAAGRRVAAEQLVHDT